MEIEIKSALVIINRGADEISLETNLPDPCWPYDDVLCLRFRAAKGTGADYVRKHFHPNPDIKEI